MILFLSLGFLCFSPVLAASPRRAFPDDFEFGVTTAAVTVEGAWNVDGKGESTWDHFTHINSKVGNGSNADLACESYTMYKRDVQMIKELGLKNYRFSIAWSRIMPEGTKDKVNKNGIDYYNNLINELLANGIEPWVTMYHWDLPQALEDQGGWLSDKMADWFGDYARILYENFGDRVKHWITSHEGFIFCTRSYETGDYPPLKKSPGKGFYDCSRNVLLSHAKAYHIYKDDFKAKQKGQVGISMAIRWAIPASKSNEDELAVKTYMNFHFDQFMNPIYGSGNYPKHMIEMVAMASKKEGLKESRLRPFTKEQVKSIKGTSDFLALSHFATKIVYRNSSVAGRNAVPSYDNDMNLVSFDDPKWPVYGIIHSYPPGFYHVMKYISHNYKNPLMYIGSNGASSYDPGLNDDFRVDYLRVYLNYLLDARAEGVNVQGYFVWSLMDKFEWTSGFATKYGLYQTDFQSSQRTRNARKSAYVYKQIVRSKVIDTDYKPDVKVPIGDA